MSFIGNHIWCLQLHMPCCTDIHTFHHSLKITTDPLTRRTVPMHSHIYHKDIQNKPFKRSRTGPTHLADAGTQTHHHHSSVLLYLLITAITMLVIIVGVLADQWSCMQDEVIVTRAPGRLDVMGGIGDYSGCLVLQKPTAEACHVACQRHPLAKQKVWKHIQNRHKGHSECRTA